MTRVNNHKFGSAATDNILDFHPTIGQFRKWIASGHDGVDNENKDKLERIIKMGVNVALKELPNYNEIFVKNEITPEELYYDLQVNGFIALYKSMQASIDNYNDKTKFEPFSYLIMGVKNETRNYIYYNFFQKKIENNWVTESELDSEDSDGNTGDVFVSLNNTELPPSERTEEERAFRNPVVRSTKTAKIVCEPDPFGLMAAVNEMKRG